MKKLLVVLLSLGLIMAFAATASAQPVVKFGGSYYLVGVYSNNPTYTGSSVQGYSRAYFQQRVRLQPVFEIAQGLTFTARMDALEKKWGDSAWKDSSATASGFADGVSSRNSVGKYGNRVQENFEFERAWVTFTTGIGMFQIGYQSGDAYGTDFADSETVRPRIVWAMPVGPVTLSAVYEKIYEADVVTSAIPAAAPVVAGGLTDADGDTYAFTGAYKVKGMEAGLLYKYYNLAQTRAAANYRAQVNLLSPYVKATFGPVYVEGEVAYFFGKSKKYEAPATTADVDVETLLAYVKAQMTMGPAYFGGQIGYASGNDPADATKNKEYSGGGTSWNPALILMSDDLLNYQLTNMGGGVTGNGLATIDNNKKNMMLYNVFAGYNPTPKINIEAAITMASAVKKPWASAGVASSEYLSDKLGTEIDIKATYKIYDNLSYMVGAGYLWVGDYFKKDRVTATVDNDYMLMNKLTLSF